MPTQFQDDLGRQTTFTRFPNDKDRKDITDQSKPDIEKIRIIEQGKKKPGKQSDQR
jgi:hypothetical protein